MTDGTVCPYCAVGCRLDREDERVVGCAGPANPEGRLCEKGLRAFDPVEAEDRLTTPLVREGGELKPASWDRAIQRAVDGIRAIQVDHGPDALAFLGAPRCTTEENYLLSKLARVLGTNNVDNRARGCHAAMTGVLAERLGRPASTNAIADLPQADVVLVVGANPARRQPVAFDTGVRGALKAGGTLVHIDPHRNATTRPAEHHLAPRPGTDHFLVSALCALIVRSDGLASSFVRNRTTGADAVLQRLERLDVDAAADRAGVERADLAAVAETVAAAERVAVMVGTGADRQSTADALVNLLLLTGNIGRPGTGIHVLRGLANEQGAVDAGCVPDQLPGHRPVSDPAARAAVTDVWGVEPPATPGRDEAALLEAAGTDVHGALVVGQNPAVAKRDADSLATNLAALSILVVAECRHSETTRHADVVFPAASGVEKTGTMTGLDRSIQRLDALATPPGEARSDLELLRRLGDELAGPDFAPPSVAGVFAEFSRVAPPYEAVDFAALQARPRRWPARSEDSAVLYRTAFDTPEGRAPLIDVARPDQPVAAETGLALVVGDRAGQFVEGSGTVDDRVTINPTDAAANGIGDGTLVRISTDGASIRTTANVSRAIRQGAVYLHASVADPLVRDGGTVVEVAPARSSE